MVLFDDTYIIGNAYVDCGTQIGARGVGDLSASHGKQINKCPLLRRVELQMAAIELDF